MLIKISKNTHPIILLFSPAFLLLTLSLILPCTANADPPVKIGDINNNDLVNLEDVLTEHTILKDCIKVSTQLTEYIRETGDIITGDTTYYWFYKGIGCVKELSGSDTYIITESYVNGANKTY